MECLSYLLAAALSFPLFFSISINAANYGEWSVERYGVRMRMHSKDKSYSKNDNIIIQFQDERTKNLSVQKVHLSGLLKPSLRNATTGKEVVFTEVATKLISKEDNPEAFYKLVDADGNLNVLETYFITAPGDYIFTHYRCARAKLTDGDGDEIAYMKIPPITFKITSVQKTTAGNTTADRKELKDYQIFKKKDMEIENNLPWSEEVFGIKGKAYIIPKVIDCGLNKKGHEGPEHDTYIHIILKNFSEVTVPAIEYGVSSDEELWNMELVNHDNNRKLSPTSANGYLFRHNYIKGISYWFDEIKPGEERHFSIRFFPSIYSQVPDQIRDSVDEEGKWSLNISREIFYSPDRMYNLDTKKEQDENLEELQVKKLKLPQLNISVKNLPKINEYE